MSDSLRPHGLQHARPPCPSPAPGVYSNSCPLSWWCHPTKSSSVIPSSSAFNLSQRQGISNESVLHIRGPKYWSFSLGISPSNEYSWLISFRMDCLDLCCSPRDSQESPPIPQFKSTNSSALSFLYSPTLTSTHDYWKNHSFDCTDLCWSLRLSRDNSHNFLWMWPETHGWVLQRMQYWWPLKTDIHWVLVLENSIEPGLI